MKVNVISHAEDHVYMVLDRESAEHLLVISGAIAGSPDGTPRATADLLWRELGLALIPYEPPSTRSLNSPSAFMMAKITERDKRCRPGQEMLFPLVHNGVWVDGKTLEPIDLTANEDDK